MRLHPAHRWIKYLVLVEGIDSVSELKTLFELNSMPPPSEGAIDDAVLGADPPSRHIDINNLSHRMWLNAEGILTLASRSVSSRKARAILNDRGLRLEVEALLLSKAPLSEIEEKYEKYAKRDDITEDVLREYMHYFWDVRNMEPPRLFKDILFEHPERRTLVPCFRQEVDYVLWKLGYVPDIDREKAMQFMATSSFFKFTETIGMDNKQSTATAAKLWYDMATDAMDALAGDDDNVTALLKKLDSINLTFKQDKPPSIDSLRGNNGS